MPYTVNGLVRWPGDSQVSGNITALSTDATGTVSSWTPPMWTTAADIASDTYAITTQGWDAVEIMPYLTGSALSFDEFALTAWFAMYDQVQPGWLKGTSPALTGAYRPRIIQCSWVSSAVADLSAVTIGGPAPSSSRLLDGPAAISSSFQPLRFPTNYIGGTAVIGTNGYERDAIVATGGSDKAAGTYTLPLRGAARMSYVITACQISSGGTPNITGVGIGFVYNLISVTPQSNSLPTL